MQSKQIAPGKDWSFELVSSHWGGWKGCHTVEPVVVLSTIVPTRHRTLYPKGNKENISCYLVLACNGRLEVVEVYVWIEDRLGVVVAHPESGCVSRVRGCGSDAIKYHIQLMLLRLRPTVALLIRQVIEILHVSRVGFTI